MILFLSPHKHHSFFTVLALSSTEEVKILCPALSLSLLLHEWHSSGLRIAKLTYHERFLSLLALALYILFKVKLLSQSTYRRFFQKLANHLIAEITSPSKIVFYQDHFSFSECIASKHILICELIIDSRPGFSNWIPTLDSGSRASIVALPCTSMQHIPLTLKKPFVLTPYGGNLADYRHKSNHNLSAFLDTADIDSPFTIQILARSNSYRKGFDLLYESLLLFENYLLTTDKSYQIIVRIAGSIQEPKMQRIYRSAQQQFTVHNKVKLQAQQYSTDEYLSVIRKSDLFIMPSRLEGSSYSALEALYLETPSILSRECGINNFKPNYHGILLDDLTSKSLYCALCEIVQNINILSFWRNQLRKDSSLFTWNPYIRAYQHSILKA